MHRWANWSRTSQNHRCVHPKTQPQVPAWTCKQALLYLSTKVPSFHLKSTQPGLCSSCMVHCNSIIKRYLILIETNSFLPRILATKFAISSWCNSQHQAYDTKPRCCPLLTCTPSCGEKSSYFRAAKRSDICQSFNLIHLVLQSPISQR